MSLDPVPAHSQVIEYKLHAINNEDVATTTYIPPKHKADVSIFRGSGAGYVSDRLGLGERAKVNFMP